MAEILPYALTPTAIWFIFSTIRFVCKYIQLRKVTKLLIKKVLLITNNYHIYRFLLRVKPQNALCLNWITMHKHILATFLQIISEFSQFVSIEPKSIPGIIPVPHFYFICIVITFTNFPKYPHTKRFNFI